MLSAMPDPVIGRAPAGLGASSWCTWSRAQRLCRRRSREGCSPAMSPTASGSTRCPVPEQRACGGVRKRHLLRLYGCATLRCPPGASLSLSPPGCQCGRLALLRRCDHARPSTVRSPLWLAATANPTVGRRTATSSPPTPSPRRRSSTPVMTPTSSPSDHADSAPGDRLLPGSVGAQVPLHACESVAVVPAAIANDTDLPDTSSARSSP